MGIRCSLLGHDYGESFVERDREERGNEVVVTERELRECNRCGAEHVTSENTEVRPIQPEPEPTPDAEAEAAASTEATDAGAPSTDDERDAGDAGGAFTSATEVIEQAETGASTGAETASAGGEDAASADPAADTDADDAVIIDDDADDEAPGSAQWDEPADPEVDPDDPGTPTPDPDDEDVEFVGSSDEPTDTDPSEPADADDPADGTGTTGATADAATQTGGDAGDLDRDHGQWPEPDGEDEGFDATPGDDPAGEVGGAADADAETGTFEFGEEPEPDPAAETAFTSAGPVDQAGADDLDFTLFCPECGFERYAAGSSLRAGDICPECKRGYLGEDR